MKPAFHATPFSCLNCVFGLDLWEVSLYTFSLILIPFYYVKLHDLNIHTYCRVIITICYWKRQ